MRNHVGIAALGWLSFSLAAFFAAKVGRGFLLANSSELELVRFHVHLSPAKPDALGF